MNKKVLIAGAAGALLFGAAAVAQVYNNQDQAQPQAQAPAADEAATDTAGTELDRAGERG